MRLDEVQQFASPEEALEHYGVKGMKWGVRKNYESVGRSAAGKVASKSAEKAASAKNQQRVASLLSNTDIMNARVSELKRTNAAPQDARLGPEAAKKAKLTSAQRKAIAGAAVVGGLVALNFYTRGRESGAFNSYALRGKAFLRGDKIPFKMNKDLAKPMSADDLLNNVAKQVNPNYSKMGGKMNCRRCTYAYELRRRGFDVHATTSAVGWGQSESGVINAVTKDSKDFFSSMSMSTAVVNTGKSSVAPGDMRTNPIKKIMMGGLMNKSPALGDLTASSSKRVLEELAKQPNGSRGEVLFKFSQFGHSMAYEIVGGKPYIFDSQKGTRYDASKLVESKWDGFDGAEITRLDNVDLDLEFLTRWAGNN